MYDDELVRLSTSQIPTYLHVGLLVGVTTNHQSF